MQSVHLVERNEDSLEELRVNSSHVYVLQGKLTEYSERIDQAEMSTENATILSVKLKIVNSSATNMVVNLTNRLDTLHSPLQNLSAIQSLIELLEEKLEMPEYNITALYQELRDMLDSQVSVRQKLEASLQRLQEQVDYLEHINSLLPQDCT